MLAPCRSPKDTSQRHHYAVPADSTGFVSISRGCSEILNRLPRASLLETGSEDIMELQRVACASFQNGYQVI